MTATQRRPSRYTEAEMARVGVQVLDLPRVRLACAQCGQRWSADIRPGGRLSNGVFADQEVQRRADQEVPRS